MRPFPLPRPRRDARGTTLIEMCFALVILAIGILAIGQLFPAGSRNQVQSRMRTTASFYAEQKIEELSTLKWSDAALMPGRHPAGTARDTLGNGSWMRFYNVEVLAAPLSNLKRVAVTVEWRNMGTRSITDTTYLRL